MQAPDDRPHGAPRRPLSVDFRELVPFGGVPDRAVECRRGPGARRPGLQARCGVFRFRAILPVVFFLGMMTFGRLLQTCVEDVIYARAISRIRTFYSEIDPSRAEYFADISVDQVGLRAMGLWRMRWQQFLAAAATVAVVNSVVGGAFVALIMRGLLGASTPVWVATVIGAAVALLLAVAFHRYQWRAWARVAKALPMQVRAGSGAGPHQ